MSNNLSSLQHHDIPTKKPKNRMIPVRRQPSEKQFLLSICSPGLVPIIEKRSQDNVNLCYFLPFRKTMGTETMSNVW